MYIRRIDTLTSKDKEKELNNKRNTYLIRGGNDFAFYSNSNLPITLNIIESIEVVNRFNIFLSEINEKPLPTAPLYKVLEKSLDGKELTFDDKMNILDLFILCWDWSKKFHSIHDNLALVPRYEVIYFACGLLESCEYENEKRINKFEIRVMELLYDLGNEGITKNDFLDNIETIKKHYKNETE